MAGWPYPSREGPTPHGGGGFPTPLGEACTPLGVPIPHGEGPMPIWVSYTSLGGVSHPVGRSIPFWESPYPMEGLPYPSGGPHTSLGGVSQPMGRVHTLWRGSHTLWRGSHPPLGVPHPSGGVPYPSRSAPLSPPPFRAPPPLRGCTECFAGHSFANPIHLLYPPPHINPITWSWLCTAGGGGGGGLHGFYFPFGAVLGRGEGGGPSDCLELSIGGAALGEAITLNWSGSDGPTNPMRPAPFALEVWVSPPRPCVPLLSVCGSV